MPDTSFHGLDGRFEREFLDIPQKLDEARFRALVALAGDELRELYDIDAEREIPQVGDGRDIDQTAGGLLVYHACLKSCARSTWDCTYLGFAGYLYAELHPTSVEKKLGELAPAWSRLIDEVVRPDAMEPTPNPFWLQHALEASSAAGGICSPDRLGEIITELGPAEVLIERVCEGHHASLREALRSFLEFGRATASAGQWLLGAEDAT